MLQATSYKLSVTIYHLQVISYSQERAQDQAEEQERGAEELPWVLQVRSYKLQVTSHLAEELPWVGCGGEPVALRRSYEMAGGAVCLLCAYRVLMLKYCAHTTVLYRNCSIASRSRADSLCSCNL